MQRGKNQSCTIAFWRDSFTSNYYLPLLLKRRTLLQFCLILGLLNNSKLPLCVLNNEDYSVFIVTTPLGMQ